MGLRSLLQKPWLRRGLCGLAAALLLVAVGGYLVLHLRYNNEALARRLTTQFNKDRRGRLEIQRVHWGPSAMWALLRGRSARLTITGLRLRDSRGRVVLEAPRAEIAVNLGQLRRGNLSIRQLRVPQGYVVWERYLRPDGPGPDGSRTEIGLLGALETRVRMRGRAVRRVPKKPPRSTRPPPRRFVAINGLALRDLTLRVAHPLGEAVLRGVTLEGSLRHIRGGGRPSALRLSLRAHAPRGHLEVNRRAISLTGVTLQGRSVGGRRAEAVELTGGLRAGGATLTLLGLVRGLPGRPQASSRITLLADRIGPALRQLGLEEVQDEGSEVALELSGTPQDPRARLRVAGLGWGTEWGALRLDEARLRLRRGRVQLIAARARAWGGTFGLSGWLTPRSGHWGFAAELLALNAPWYLRRHMQEMDAAISGLVHGHGTLRGDRRSWLHVTATATRRTASSPLPQVLTLAASVTGSSRRLVVRQIAAWSERGALIASGAMDLRQRTLRGRLAVQAWRLRQHLRPLGHRPFIDGLAIEGTLRGHALNPAFVGELQLMDFRTPLFRVPLLRSKVVFTDGTLYADALRSPRYMTYLSARVRLRVHRGSLRELQRPALSFSWGLRK